MASHVINTIELRTFVFMWASGGGGFGPLYTFMNGFARKRRFLKKLPVVPV